MKRPGIISKALGRARKGGKKPLDVILTLKINLGDQPGDAVTLLEEQRIPLVGSVFENRERIAREFVSLMIKAGAQPRALRKLLGQGSGR